MGRDPVVLVASELLYGRGPAGLRDSTARPDCKKLGCKDKMSSTLPTVQLNTDQRWGSANMLDGVTRLGVLISDVYFVLRLPD